MAGMQAGMCKVLMQALLYASYVKHTPQARQVQTKHTLLQEYTHGSWLVNLAFSLLCPNIAS
jgi:hypothetical protein